MALTALSNMRVITKGVGKTRVKQHSAVLQLGAYRKLPGQFFQFIATTSIVFLTLQIRVCLSVSTTRSYRGSARRASRPVVRSTRLPRRKKVGCVIRPGRG